MKKLHRFIGDFHFTQPLFTLSDEKIIFQILQVLRFKCGEKFILCDGKGKEASVILRDIQKKHVELEVSSITSSHVESELQITLYCSILKSDHFEFVAQKCTEVGVFQIIPIITERTVKLNLRHDRIQKIIQEAAEQSGRAIVPALGYPLEFEEALELSKNHEKNFFLDFGAKKRLKDFSMKNIDTVGLFIGPEGGFESHEQKRALDAGFQLADLGNLTLRAETAAMISTYILRSSLE